MNPAIRSAVIGSIALGVCLPVTPGVSLAGGDLAAVPSHAATSPASVPASRPSGRWSCWSARLYGPPQAITPQALWFGTGGHVWRYDRKTETTLAFSALDGLPLEEGSLSRLVAASDERCAVLIDRPKGRDRAFLWHPKEGWRVLPAAEGAAMMLDIGFDPADRLLALCQHGKDLTISELVSGKWKELFSIPATGLQQTLIPLAEGPVIWGCTARKTVATFISYADPANVTTNTGQGSGVHYAYPRYFRSGDKTICFFFPRLEKISHANVAYEMRPDGYHEFFTGDYIGPDLKGGGMLSCKVLKTTEDFVRLRPDVPDAPEVEIRFDSRVRFEPFLDIDGRLWWGTRRWDGKQWLSLTAEWEFPGDYFLAHKRYRLRLAKDGSSWSVIDPEVPLTGTGYDPEKRAGWIWGAADDGSVQLQLIALGGQKPEVLRTVPFNKGEGMPWTRTADGDWWWHGATGVFRLTSKGVQKYADKGSSQIALSPKGNIWACWIDKEVHQGSSWKYLRYEARTDAFVDDAPWEDFAFTLGKLRLSYVPPMEPYNMAELYCKTDGQWVQFRTPFASEDAHVARDAVFGDRLLVTVHGVGVLEYNATAGQWARLTAGDNQKPSFDALGRRIISGQFVLVYDGDPSAGFKPSGDDEDFRQLLKRLDDERYTVRDEATRQMASQLEKHYARISEAADNPSLSLEVRSRLKGMLPRENAVLPAPPALFRTMHPVLLPLK